VQEEFGDRAYIIRLPALFGPFLKKNLLYDLLENTQSMEIHLDNEYQFYGVHHLYRDIEKMLSSSLSIHRLHLFPEPISVRTLVDLIQTVAVRENRGSAAAELSLAHHTFIEKQSKVYHCGSIYPWTITSSETIQREICLYIAHYHFWKHQLVVMPICVPHIDQQILKQYDIRRYEIAPFSIWGSGWERRRDEELLQKECPVPLDEIVRFHGILYPHSWNLWDDGKQVLEYFENVAEFIHHLFGNLRNKFWL
jgi:hypothetical protein